MAKMKFGKRLQQFFGFEVTANKETSKISIKPVDKVTGKPINFPTRVEKLWSWYLKETNDKVETLKNRTERYADIDYMIYNETLASFTVDLYADEIAQADDQFNLIQVTAKNAAIEKRIKELLNLWEIDQEYIREVGYNLVAYGDSFDINEIDEKKGIISVTPVNVNDISERLEFKLSETKKAQRGSKSLRIASVDKFIRDLEKENLDYSKSYLSYLFGFVLNEDEFLYPWQVSHYRLESKRSEFFPYGRSLLINLIGPYRQLKTSTSLMALTRAMKFPKEVYEVSTSDEMTSIEKWNAVNEARTEFQNSGILNKTKDEFSVGDELWIPEGLLNHTSITNDLRIEDIADIELLRENFIIGTKIPKGYLIADRSGSWGTSSQSLLQQSKPFGRAVFSCQSSILKEISHKIRMHFLMTGEFEKEYTEFQLSLNFPVVEEASDRQRLKQDSMQLVVDVVDNIKSAMGLRDANIPPEIIKDLFAKFSFLDSEIIDDVVNALASQVEESTDKKENKRLYEEYKKLDESILSASLFESIKKMEIKECKINGRHYMTSCGKFIQNEYINTYKMYRFVENDKKIEG